MFTENLPDLTKYGIVNANQIIYNPSYDDLYNFETDPSLEGFEKGYVTNLGSVAVDTGIFTGRSPKDKYIVRDETTDANVWWAANEKKSSDNKPISKEVWNDLLGISRQQLSGKKLFVMDAYLGANENSRLKIRVITEVAWAAHFVKNMFIRPQDSELNGFEPDFVMLHACKTINPKWEEHKLNSDVFVAFNLSEKMAVVGGTWYGGEIKKGFFSVMNYFLPLNGMASMHCSANMGKNGDTAIFFGLSGTGKTTLSADPDRFLIGDDEHGWDNDGVFNLEGGCYAKCINLNPEKEPDIFNAIRRDALLENVVFNAETGAINFDSAEKTENTRVSYPIHHIRNIVTPVSRGTHPKKIIFLTADAFGVLPPVAKLNKEQAMYYFLSGFTSKLAGTERGIKEPVPTFSACFGAAFLMLHPTVYAAELAKKMEEHGSTAYLVNTGWIEGPYGIGRRIDLPVTREIIKSILDGSIDDTEFEELPIFGLSIPKRLGSIDPKILNPRNTWKYPAQYDNQAEMLAEKFIANFQNFTDSEIGQRLVAAGPHNKLMKQFYRFYQEKIENLEMDHKSEIIRLKDQIYILQNAFSEYISFNSINSSYKKRSLTRHLPVTMYIGSEDQTTIQDVHTAMMKIIKTIGFSFYNPDREPTSFSERMGYSHEKMTMKELYDGISQIFDALNFNDNENVELNQTIREFREVISGIDDIILRLGSVLFVKTRINGLPVCEVKKLSISGLIHIDKHPELLSNPAQLYKELYSFQF